jgi:3-mercaptopyruvate sulfurtransferase SseA
VKICKRMMSLIRLTAILLCSVYTTAFATLVFAEAPIAQGKDDIMRADLRMSVDEVQKHVGRGSATIVDLRSDVQYRGGHIRGAISVQLHEIDAKLSEIASRHEPVFIYCD